MKHYLRQWRKENPEKVRQHRKPHPPVVLSEADREFVEWYKTVRLPQLEAQLAKQRGTETHWACPYLSCGDEWFDLTPEERAGLPNWHWHIARGLAYNSSEAPLCSGLTEYWKDGYV